ncbi:hypothetical protein [Shimia sediminis]|uniref:hypothetical protein n=1 Tax=Shimia sediminis TaxID=2497945 RepID=UPI000F8DB823|nr:hypothetical protein [Shimia sediminis]
MYKYALQLFRVYWQFILATSVILFAFDIWAATSAIKGLVPKFFVYGFLIFNFHFTTLKGIRVSAFGSIPPGGKPTFNFWFAYGLPVAAIVVVFFVSFNALNEPYGTSAAGYSTLIMLVAFGLFLALFGTMIPAATVGTSVGLRAALRRSRQSFWFVLWRLILGPGLYGVCLFSLVIVLQNKGIIPPEPQAFAQVTPINALWSVTITILGLFNSALTATILSMAYLHVEEQGRRPQL